MELRGVSKLLKTTAILVTSIAFVAQANADEYWQSADSTAAEVYVEEPMPPGFRVERNELEGPVFADAKGRTLYSWPLERLRNGDLGDRQNDASTCTDEVQTVNTGLMSPYPGGLELPDLETRPSCVDVWPPVLAAADSEPLGKWTITEREDGSKQWSYDGYPLYTSILDINPGDVLGGSKFREGADSPVVRKPVGPSPLVPPELAVTVMFTGRMLVNHENYSAYSWDGDAPNKSNCHDSCLKTWEPVLAPETAQAQGEWTIIERSPGIKQWAFREKPLYTRPGDTRLRSLAGSDSDGWHNVYTQQVLAPPKEFTIQDARIGHVLADSEGMAIYVYNCGDDAQDQLACDHPDSPQAYRLAICGGGDPDKCLKTWPYVLAPEVSSSESSLWTVEYIDPKTGRWASPEQSGALRIWAYRGRPVYTFSGDQRPGETRGDAWGEFYGARNGFKAFWLRDDFLGNAG